MVEMTEEELYDRIEDFKDEALEYIPGRYINARERIRKATSLKEVFRGISAFLEEMRPKDNWRNDHQHLVQKSVYRVYKKNLFPVRNAVDKLARDLVIVAEERVM